MATFQIHQDSEKENANGLVGGDKLRTIQGGKDTNKRSTFAVLNNVANNPRVPQGKTNFRDIKTNINDENAIPTRMQPRKANGIVGPSGTSKPLPVPVEQFKFFTVFEDNNKSKGIENEPILNHLDESIQSANSSIHNANRDPLKDITSRSGGLLETPMSVSDVLSSPMSIDKSTVSNIDDSIISADEKHAQFIPRNDRERFFEVEEYQHNILEYFREIEKKHRPKPTYMQRQPDINYSMRTILVDWLVEVSEEYRLHTETLFLAISYIDRFLSYMSVVRAKLQLVGTAAMFIAAKYEEIYPPDVGEFVFITDDTYTKTQVLRMEQIMLKILSFDLCVPTSFVFINTYAVLYKMSDQVKFLATYISELSLLEGDPYLQYLPSLISSGSIGLARYILKLPMWDEELELITSYKLNELREIMLQLCRTHNLVATLPQQAIQEKYKNNKYLEVSIIKPVTINAENIDEIFVEQNKLIIRTNKTENLDEVEEGADVESSTIGNAAPNNESVRKMISSLMFV